VEPVPTPRAAGRIIFLNGASSSGKSTLARSLQATLAEPFLHIASDQFVAAGMLPPRRDDGGPFNW
jgi:chloramphenicol 3-O phosphotransferase